MTSAVDPAKTHDVQTKNPGVTDAMGSLSIPLWLPEKWQSIVDTVAELADVPSGLVMRTVGDQIEVLVSSRTVGNPYKPGEAMRLPDSGLYCEHVIRNNRLLAIPNALLDAEWKDNPDVELNMISYLGVPIQWPDATPFGTLCILDSKTRSHPKLVERLLGQFRDMIEHHLSLIYGDSQRELEVETDKRRHAEALQSSEQRFKLLVEHAADDVLLHDDHGKILDANLQAARNSGLGAERIRGASVTDLPIHIADRWGQMQWSAAEPGQTDIFEATYLLPNKSVATVEVRWTCQVVRGDKLFLILVRDVSERRRAEESLRSAEAELARASRLTMMGQLAGSIVHEINQPLTAIATRAEACVRWLDRNVPNIEQARESARLLSQAAQDASEIVKGLRAIAERSVPLREPLDFNEVVVEVLSLTRRECGKLGVTCEVRTDALPAILNGDRTQIKQIVLNLVLNAIEAMKDVNKDLRKLSITTSLTDDANILLSIEDSGLGLQGQDPKRLFQPLFTTKSKGMGMGLAICRTIAQAHGGRIWAEDRTDPTGARFFLCLPSG